MRPPADRVVGTGEDDMPSWVKSLLKWGGIALAVVFAIALALTQFGAPEAAEGAGAGAPVGLRLRTG